MSPHLILFLLFWRTFIKDLQVITDLQFEVYSHLTFQDFKALQLDHETCESESIHVSTTLLHLLSLKLSLQNII